MARVAAAGLDGIAVEAGKVLIAGRAEAIERANEARVFVAGVGDVLSLPETGEANSASSRPAFRRLGRVEPSSHVLEDASRGVGVLNSLRPFAPAGSAVVVARNHVLAVEAGEGALATVERAVSLKQWASLTHRRRGVAVVARAEDLTPALIARIDRAGYAGAAVMDGTHIGAAAQEAIAAADAAKVCVLAAIDTAGEAA
jgi:DUF1009 family protein